MSNEQVISVGEAGPPNYERSDLRAYWTADVVYQSVEDVMEDWAIFYEQSQRLSRRREVFRFRATSDVVELLLQSAQTPVEAVIPLSLIDPHTEDSVVIMAENRHDSPVPEWDAVYSFWKEPRQMRMSPLERIQHVQESEEFQVINTLNPADALRLSQIWAPFGWSQAGVEEFISELPTTQQKWFAGVRYLTSGQLVSACMAEQLEFSGVRYVETTEYGTYAPRPQGLRQRDNQNGRTFEGRGFCAASVSALHAQILRDTLYRDGSPVLIGAEFNMNRASRSDVVGRNVGYTVPYVEGNPHLQSPFQVLRYNVAVEDRGDPNSLYLPEFAQTNYQYWRNFIVGILPREAIVRYYSPTETEAMLQLIEASERN